VRCSYMNINPFYRYIEGLLKIEDVETSRKVIHSILNKYRSAGGDIIHVVHDAPEGAPIFTPNTRLAEIADELAPRENEPVIFSSKALLSTKLTLPLGCAQRACYRFHWNYAPRASQQDRKEETRAGGLHGKIN